MGETPQFTNREKETTGIFLANGPACSWGLGNRPGEAGRRGEIQGLPAQREPLKLPQ